MQSRTSRLWPDRWLPEVIAVLCAAILAVLYAPLNTDSGYCLVVGRRLLEGDRLYVDLFDPNPPLIFWLNAFVALVGRGFRIPDSQLVGSALGIVLTISVLLAHAVLSLPPAASRRARSGLLCGFLIALVLLSPFDVGQRDQLAAILFFPYTLLAVRAARGLGAPMWMALAGGLLAGVGIGLKPYFLLPWVAVEVAVVALRRDLRSLVRAEVATVLLIQCLFVAALLALAPGYLTTVVPLARETYWAYAMSSRVLLVSRPVLFLACCGLAAVATSCLPSASRHALAPVLGAATLGFLASFVAQVGFTYQLIPAQVFAAVALIAAADTVVAGSAGIRSGPWWQRAALALIGCAVLVAAVRVTPLVTRLARNLKLAVTSPYPPAIQAMADTVAEVAVGEPVYFLSTSVWPAFPVVNLGRATWPYHYNFLWPIPAFYAGPSGPPYRRPGDQSATERAFFDTVVADLVKTPPRLLVVERGTGMQAMRGRDFDFVEYFSGSPEFAALFRRYRRLGQIAAWDFYELPP